MHRSPIKKIYRVAYLFGIIFILIGFILSITQGPVKANQGENQVQPDAVIEWDQSSLVFDSGCEGDCDLIYAVIRNHGRPMGGPTTYEVWYSATGNPMNAPDRQLLYTGVIPALPSEGTYTITFDPELSGNYKFRVIQRPGHPGQGELWSTTCTLSCTVVTPTFTQTMVPTSTFTVTPTFTNTPEPTATFTFTPTVTQTFTNTPTLTFTPTITHTFTPTVTYTFTPTLTSTSGPGPTPTDTNTPTITLTFTPTLTDTPEPTLTFTPTLTDTPEPSPTFTFTPTFTDTPEPTNTSFPGPTPTPTTEVVTATPGSTEKPTATPEVVKTLPPPSVQTPSVLIPVTGADNSSMSMQDLASRIFINLGLAFLGLALTLQAFSKRITK